MVETGWLPGACVVTGATVRAQATQMNIVLLVATHAGHRRVTELGSRKVAFLAHQGGVFTIQLEYIEVVECGWLPGSGGMTGFACSAFGASMHIILLMAANASHRCAFEFAIDMTLGALHFDMRAIQLKR